MVGRYAGNQGEEVRESGVRSEAETGSGWFLCIQRKFGRCNPDRRGT